jgi:cyanophycin synthetase
MSDANLTFDLLDWARVTPDAPALVSAGTTLTYQALDALTWACAGYLHDQALRAGDVVALTFVEDLALAVALQAVARLGAAGFSLPRSTGAVERRALAQRAGARCLVGDWPASFESGVPAVTLDIRAAARAPRPATAALLDERPRAPWQIILGSGSTGAPRLIPVTHAQARSRFQAQVRAASIGPGDGLAAFSNLEFATAKHRVGWAMAAGASFAILERDGGNPLDLLKPLGVTLLGASVFHAERILTPGNAVDFAAFDGLRAFSVAGSVVGDDLRTRLRDRLGDRIWVAYGVNEAGHLTLATPPDLFDTPGTVGRPLQGVELEIVDPACRPVPVAAAGEVRIRGPGVIAGYWREDAAASGAFRDGWFHPGDRARIAPDGQVIHLGRADRMMIFDGINIDPAEIERALAAHPAVREAAVVALRSRVHQDVPICAVVLQDGGGASEAELLAHARARLGRRGPARVVVLPEIPRNAAGKLASADLAARLLDRLGRVE